MVYLINKFFLKNNPKQFYVFFFVNSSDKSYKFLNFSTDLAADISSIWRVVLPTLDCLVLINLTKWFVPTTKENFFVTLKIKKIINHTNKNKAVLPGVSGILWERCAEKNVVNVCLNSMWWEVEGSGVLFGRDDYGNERLSYVGRVCLMLAVQ